MMELGLYTFADVGPEIEPARRLRNLLEEIELADQAGLDVFGVGEHHRPDYAVSAPAVVLAAAAERTKNIRLTSAVTVLSSDDPVRVFQDFASLDLLSGGRAEIMARCRSGSPSAGRRSRSSAPRSSVFRWRSRSSADSPSTSRRSPGSTARLRAGPATTRRGCRSASTRTPMWPQHRSKQATSTSPPTPR
jgi:hypothetical protein